MQLLLCLYPNNLKKILIDANIGTTLSWSQLNDEADIILSTLKEAGPSLYDPLPTGKSVPPFNPSISPLCPPLKSVLLFHHQFLPSMSMALLQQKFNIKSCLHLTRLQLPKFLSQKFIRLSLLVKVMMVNKNMSASTVNLIKRRHIIISHVSSCACFLLVSVAIRHLCGVTLVQR